MNMMGSEVSLEPHREATHARKAMDLAIKDLRVLVTAGANGIGLAIARAFVAEGARVHVCDVDEAAIARLAQTDPTITGSRADVSDRSQVETLFRETVEHLGGNEVLEFQVALLLEDPVAMHVEEGKRQRRAQDGAGGGLSGHGGVRLEGRRTRSARGELPAPGCCPSRPRA